MASNDDDFGGFEEANNLTSQSNVPYSSASFHLPQDSSNEIQKPNETKRDDVLPEWLLKRNALLASVNNSNIQPMEINDDNLKFCIKNLREQIDNQNDVIRKQARMNQDLEMKLIKMNTTFLNAFKELKDHYDNELSRQKEANARELHLIFEKNLSDQEQRLAQMLKVVELKFQNEMNVRLENKLCEMQEKLIKYTESQYEDIEMKMKNMANNLFKEENIVEKFKLKSTIDNIEKNLKGDVERYSNSLFLGQSELLKEQIKSAMLQEHLIHKDLINSQLAKVVKMSEDKRRAFSLAFTRHLSGLNFFVDNAHKQLSILKEAHKDFVKNKQMVDENYLDKNFAFSSTYKGDTTPNINITTPTVDDALLAAASLYSLEKELCDIGILDRPTIVAPKVSPSKEELVDESLLQELT